MKNVLLTGGTGFVGKILAKYFRENGYNVMSLSSEDFKIGKSKIVDNDGLIIEDILATMDAVVNLAGSDVGKKWNEKVKQEIINSRIKTTRCIVQSIERNKNSEKNYPKVLVSASAIGFYGYDPHEEQQTETTPKGYGFLAAVCEKWEEVANSAIPLGIRVVIFRMGIVLGPNGGVLQRMENPSRFKLSGIMGNGKQRISWINYKDVRRAFLLALEVSNMQGVYNLTSPNPVPFSVFMKNVAENFAVPSKIHMPKFLAHLLWGKIVEELLFVDQNAYPRRLLEEKFIFLFPDINSCMIDIYKLGD